MVTFGLAIILAEGVHLIWGPQPRTVAIPDLLRGVVFILNQPFPIYRLFLIGIGAAAAIALWQFLERTRAGLLIRAVSQNAEMVHALGTDVALVRTGIFMLGCAIAALGGVLSAPLVTAFLGMGSTVIIDAFVIVIIGGMGSFLGSIVGSLARRLRAGVRRLLFPGFGAGDHLSADADGPDRSPGRPARQGAIRCASVLLSP